jgi:hypothetical protein
MIDFIPHLIRFLQFIRFLHSKLKLDLPFQDFLHSQLAQFYYIMKEPILRLKEGRLKKM